MIKGIMFFIMIGILSYLSISFRYEYIEPDYDIWTGIDCTNLKLIKVINDGDISYKIRM